MPPTNPRYINVNRVGSLLAGLQKANLKLRNHGKDRLPRYLKKSGNDGTIVAPPNIRSTFTQPYVE